MRSYSTALAVLIPFYQKCVVPTFEPDPIQPEYDPHRGSVTQQELRSTHLSCCSLEKRRFPKIALNSAFSFRDQHLKQPLEDIQSQLAEMTNGDIDSELLSCPLRSRLKTLQPLLDSYDKGITALENVVEQLVTHICYSIGSHIEPNLDDVVAVSNEMAAIMKAREDSSCNLDNAAFMIEDYTGEAAMRTQLLEIDLHNIPTIDSLPMPKNWTWDSNKKIWEEVRNEDPHSVNSSLVLNYDSYRENDNSFLAHFIENQAIILGTPLSTMLLELQSLLVLKDEEIKRDRFPPSTVEEEQRMAELEQAIPSLASMRPSKDRIKAERLIGKTPDEMFVIMPTVSTMPEVSSSTTKKMIGEHIREIRELGRRELDRKQEEEKKDDREDGKAVEKSDKKDGKTVEKSDKVDDKATALNVIHYIEYARQQQYTRASPELCLKLIREKGSGINNYAVPRHINGNTTSPTMHCRWIRYPETSTMYLDVNHPISSVGIRNSEENRLFQAVSLQQRNAELQKEIFEEYVVQHQAWRRGEKSTLSGAVVAVCYGLPICGGHGDRVHGILSLFLFAVATKRGFLIDYRAPLPLQRVLWPSFIDWRIRIEDLELQNRVQLVDITESNVNKKLRGLKASPQVILVGTNLRFHYPLIDWFQEEYNPYFTLTSSWVTQVWNLLFKPAPVIMNQLRMSPPKPFLAIHFRAGNETLETWTDPGRHSLDLMDEFLKCAAHVEKLLTNGYSSNLKTDILDPKVPFYVSTDTTKVWENGSVRRLTNLGKLRPLLDSEAIFNPDSHDINDADKKREIDSALNALLDDRSISKQRLEPITNSKIASAISENTAGDIVHVDRTSVDYVLQSGGFTRSWTEYLSLSRATAIIISNSFFGETAAEIGNVPFVFYGEGCIPVDL